MTELISNNKNPSHKYGDTGYFSVTLIVKIMGVKIQLPFQITFISIHPLQHSQLLLVVTIKCHGILKIGQSGPLTWKWDFG